MGFKPGDMVVCINNSDWGTSRQVPLKKGEIYTVVELADESYPQSDVIIRGDSGVIPLTWSQSRFVHVGAYSPVTGSSVKSNVKPIDDYVCLRCKNSKLSKTEKSCWSCGELVKP